MRYQIPSPCHDAVKTKPVEMNWLSDTFNIVTAAPRPSYYRYAGTLNVVTQFG